MSIIKKITKIKSIVLLVIVLLIAGAVVYIRPFLPNVPLEDLQVKITPERLERGRYLFNNLAGRKECHSARNPNLQAMPVKEGTDGQGGMVFDHKEGLPGSFVANNITPFHLKHLSDGEIFWAITSGVTKGGHALFPLMPYKSFGHADKEDILSIIAYLRTLEPIKNDLPVSHSDFPMSIIIHTIPGKPDFHPVPDKNNSVQYGSYLANLGNCITCHSQANKGKLIAGMEFAGGRKVPIPTGGIVSSANITPDIETVIGSWTKQAFLQRFRNYSDTAFNPAAITAGSFNTVMPWMQFGQLTTDDLSAIYDFLRTVKPVKSTVF
ncbi:MAG: c-type cytochrome [Chitinophagaceae bacterium]